MYKRFFSILFCMLFFHSSVYSQKKEDKVLAEIIEKIDSLSDKDIKATYFLIDELDSMLAIQPNPKYQWVSYMQRASTLHWEDKLELSDSYFQKAIKIVEETNDTSGTLKVYSNYANMLMSQDKNEEALRYYDKVLSLTKKDKKYALIEAYVYYYLGSLYRLQNDSISISNYIRSYEMANELKIDELSGAVQYKLALIYKRQKKYTKATEAFALAEKSNGENSVRNFAVYGAWGKVLALQGNLDGAIEKFEEVLNHPKASKRNLIYTYNSLGIMMKDNDRLDDAKYYLRKGIEMGKGDERYRAKFAQLLANLGGVYYDEEAYVKALPYYEESKEILLYEPKSNIENKHLILGAYLETVLKVQNVGDLDETFQNYQIYTDSLLTLQQNSIDEEMIEKYRAEVKEAENKELLTAQKLKEEQIMKQQKMLFGGLSALGIFSILTFLFYRQREKQKQLNTELISQRDQIKILNRELNHRVKNNLAFMTSLLEMQGRRTENTETKQILRESESRLKALSIVHDNLFQNETQTTINLKKYLIEITTHLQNIFEVPGKSLTVETHLADIEFDAEDAMRVGLVVNELVTNSVKHAFTNVDNPMIILETTQHTNGKIVLRYKDNGPGYVQKDLKSETVSGSIGMKLIQLLERQLESKLDLQLG